MSDDEHQRGEAGGEVSAAPSGDVQSDGSLTLLSSATNKVWAPLSASRPDEDGFLRFQRSLIDILQSHNLVVLCGLGTSLCLKGIDDKPIAPTMTNLWDEAAAQVGFEDIVKKVNYPVPQEGKARNKDIELLLSHCQLLQMLQPDDAVKQFIENTEAMIVKRCRFVSPALSLFHHQAFLLKVARRSTRLPRMKLFTTNYDLCFETAASGARFTVVDGFSHTLPQEFDGSHFDFDFVRRLPDHETPDYIPSVFHLYKMHGSVDWVLLDKERRIRREEEPSKPHLIYPRHTKYQASYDQPFLEMMSRLQIAMRQPNTGLLIIGFGFNDFHITQPLMAAVDSNVSLKCMVVSPSLQQNVEEQEHIRRLASLISHGDLRLSLLAGTFEEFVAVVPDLVARTAEEEHRSRIRTVAKS